MASDSPSNGGGERIAPDPIDLPQLAARWRSGVEWDDLMRRVDYEEIPERLNAVNSSAGFNFVSPEDKLTVHYSGVQQHGHEVSAVEPHGHDVGAVQANCPAPTQRFVYYFEMTVKNAGLKGQIAIGFTPPGVKLCRQPGWEPNTCGYHGDDGYIYRGPGKSDNFGPKFTTGDTVGAGINYGSQEFFFTKNGRLVGVIEKNLKGPIFPTVAVHSQNEEIIVNFGKRPFMFDIEGYQSGERRKQQSTIDNVSIGVDVIHSIVRSYLQHYGYEDTLTSFDSESETVLRPVRNMQEDGACDGNEFESKNRKILRELIRNGDIDNVFVKLREWHPEVLQNEMSTICFLLHSQRFIEHIRRGSLEDAVYYARTNLAKFLPVKSLEPLLQEYIALLAYENPTVSSLSHLLDMGQREIVADAVNAAILSTRPANAAGSGSSVRSGLEVLLRQLTVCRLELQALRDNQGEAFYLHKALRGSSRRG